MTNISVDSVYSDEVGGNCEAYDRSHHIVCKMYLDLATESN